MNPIISFTKPLPVFTMLDAEGREIGRLDFTGPEMKFTGNAEESAKVFFQFVARQFSLTRPEARATTLDEEWNAAIEAAAALVDLRHDPCEPWMDGDDVRELKRRFT